LHFAQRGLLLRERTLTAGAWLGSIEELAAPIYLIQIKQFMGAIARCERSMHTPSPASAC